MEDVDVDQVLELISIAEEYLLPGLKDICQVRAAALVNTESAPRLLFASEKYGAPLLKEQCLEFILKNVKEMLDSAQFRQEIQNYPSLSLIILQAAAGKIDGPKVKRMRLTPQRYVLQ